MSIFFAVIIGVFSSLIATFIFLVLSAFVKKVVIPWFEDKIYKGIRVGGKWKAESNEDIGFDVTLLLTQKAERISGILTASTNNGTDSTSYNFEGSIRNSYLNAVAWPVSNSLIDAGGMLMKIYSSKGLKMIGVITFINQENNTVESLNITLKLVDN